MHPDDTETRDSGHQRALLAGAVLLAMLTRALEQATRPSAA